MTDTNSLSHSKWNCKYHIVFKPKYRRQVIYGKIKADVGKILRQLCEQKGCDDTRSRSMPRSYPYVGEYTAKFKRGTIYGIPEREKQPDSCVETGVEVWVRCG